MKKQVIIFFTFLFLPFIVFAEYNGHQIEFTIELNNGEKVIGYNYLASVYQSDKTIDYKEFLEKNYEIVLRNQYNDSLGELTYFLNRIKYNYLDYNGDSRFIYTLTDKKAIDKQQIKSFKIIELTSQSYAIGISTEHKWEDRFWMSKNPIEKISTAGYLCEFQIFIHETNSNIEQLKKKLEIVAIELDKEIKEQQKILENSNGKSYHEAGDKIEELEGFIDIRISELLQEFNGMKVVIISMCTC